MSALPPMRRAEFVRQIAYEYAEFEASYPAGTNLAPLDRAFAFSVGRGYIETGRYNPRRDYRYLDWSRYARDARKVLPRMRRDLAKYGGRS